MNAFAEFFTTITDETVSVNERNDQAPVYIKETKVLDLCSLLVLHVFV